MFGFDVNKLKPNLKMAVSRIGIVKNKKKNAAAIARREVAELLAEGKEEKARIRVEGIIRDDFTMEGYEILELLAELVAERCNLIKSESECPYDMREAVNTLIWAASRTEIPELTEVKKQFTKKYGQDFAAAAYRNVDGCVNPRVIERLSVKPPSAYLVVNYMMEIAKQYKVNWEPDETAIPDPLAPAPAPTGTSVPLAVASGPDFAALYEQRPPPGKAPSALPNLPTKKIPGQGSLLPSAGRNFDALGAAKKPAKVTRATVYGNIEVTPSAADTMASSTSSATTDSSGSSAVPHSYHSPSHTPPRSPTPYAPHLNNVDTFATSPPHRPRTPPKSNLTPPPAPAASTPVRTPGAAIPEFDELEARFERLRQRQDAPPTSFTF